MISSKFIVHKHEAKKRGLHWDIRFKMPHSKNWASFASYKEPPIKSGERHQRHYITRTNDHSEKQALFTGTIPDGQYGAGKLSVWDEGRCSIVKYSSAHMVVEFKGSKMKGKYHFINTGVYNKDRRKGKAEYKQKIYAFFKAKN